MDVEQNTQCVPLPVKEHTKQLRKLFRALAFEQYYFSALRSENILQGNEIDTTKLTDDSQKLRSIIQLGQLNMLYWQSVDPQYLL